MRSHQEPLVSGLYTVSGARGPTMLCIHGWAQNMDYFETLAAQLVPDIRVVSLDLNRLLAKLPEDGCIRSGALQELAGLVASFIDSSQKSLKIVAALGHSMGGVVLARACRQGLLPVELRRIFVATPFHPVRLPLGLAGSTRRIEGILRLYAGLPRWARIKLAAALYRGMVVDPRAISDAMISAAADLPVVNGARILDDLSVMKDSMPASRSLLSQGAIIIHGQSDRIADPKRARSVAIDLGHDWHSLEEVGHSPCTEAPEEVAQILRNAIGVALKNDPS